MSVYMSQGPTTLTNVNQCYALPVFTSNAALSHGVRFKSRTPSASVFYLVAQVGQTPPAAAGGTKMRTDGGWDSVPPEALSRNGNVGLFCYTTDTAGVVIDSDSV